ncbi:tripartite-type tricarboxylate transporter receptor subunit TctC [Variovorax boronicumulans]|uniref:Bug family tripartite tricarboxylate transporter substrate binding protein n=1 Tax=Variovorax boronicumulans TaxID=436515 RepID=UPI002475E66E|nr:tripartite tricarboxylate transporter substrate binding protein [Variovorax boronicumulans]MDH6169990.1 tripartite-type tricarboxylate transporter receptor subunit TctC [Variovorax boronicumulans]
MKNKTYHLFATGLIVIASVAAATCAAAQVFPSQPIKVVVTFPPGVTPDTTARLLATKLGEVMGQPVVVDNRPGAGGTIGAGVVAKSVADGYTVLYAPNSVFTMAPHMYRKLPYTSAELEPVSIVGELGYVLLANKDLRVSNLKEAVDYIRARPGKVNFASYGVGTGTHLTMELLQKELGLKMEHIAYKSSPIPDLISGQVQFLFEPYGGQGLESAKAGQLKALGVSLRKRSPELPTVPSISEVAPSYESPGWLGFWLPAKTPAAVQKKYQEALTQVMAMPEVKAKFRGLSIDATNSGPRVMANTIQTQSALWGTLLKDLSISLE